MAAFGKQWRIRGVNEPTPYYGKTPRGRRFTLKIHHYGDFHRNAAGQDVWKGKVDYVDYVNIRTFDYHDLNQMVQYLNHTSIGYFLIYWRIPPLSITNGLEYADFITDEVIGDMKLHLQGPEGERELDVYLIRNRDSTCTSELGLRLPPGQKLFPNDSSSNSFFDDEYYMSDARS